MSKKVPGMNNSLQDVRVDVTKPKKQPPYEGGMEENRRNDFVYVNPAYVGSMNSVSERLPEPPTSVYREQYWACSRWPYGQKVMAAAVGLLVGAVIGLAVTMVLKQTNSDSVIGGIFSAQA